MTTPTQNVETRTTTTAARVSETNNKEIIS